MNKEYLRLIIAFVNFDILYNSEKHSQRVSRF